MHRVALIQGTNIHHKIYLENLYILYIGQSDFTSTIAAIGIGRLHEYLLPVISQIAATIKVRIPYDYLLDCAH